MKKQIHFHFAIVLVFLVQLIGCAPLAPTVEDLYVKEMKQGENDFFEWYYGPVASLDAMLGSETDGVTVRDFLTGIQEFGWMNDIDSVKNIKATLTETAGYVSEQGFPVLSTLEGIEPPLKMKTAHETLIECTRYKIEVANDLQSALAGRGEFPPLGAGKCAQVDQAYAQILDFMRER